MLIDHEKARLLLHRSLVEGISLEERHWLDAHVGQCAECTRYADLSARAVGALDWFALELDPAAAHRVETWHGWPVNGMSPAAYGRSYSRRSGCCHPFCSPCCRFFEEGFWARIPIAKDKRYELAQWIRSHSRSGQNPGRASLRAFLFRGLRGAPGERPRDGYIYADAARRGMPPIPWTALAVLIPNCVGFVLYFLLRKPILHPCPSCGRGVAPDAAFCPRCGQPQMNMGHLT